MQSHVGGFEKCSSLDGSPVVQMACVEKGEGNSWADVHKVDRFP